VDKLCWFSNPSARQGTCELLHDLKVGNTFDHPYNTNVNNRTMALLLGKRCESGFARTVNNTSGECVELTNITSNIDGHYYGLSLSPLQTFKTCNLSYN
jgi:hypothetical protein